MDKVAVGFGSVFLTLCGFFLLIIARTFFGALAGWIVGLVFGGTILGIVAQLGVHGIVMWQLGAFLAFVGGFLATKVSATVKEAKSAK